MRMGQEDTRRKMETLQQNEETKSTQGQLARHGRHALFRQGGLDKKKYHNMR